MTPLISLGRAAAAGFATGLRSMTPIAAASGMVVRGETQVPRKLPFSLLGDRRVAALLILAAAGEMVADLILPLPARVGPVPLVWRINLGAVVGGIVGANDGSFPVSAAAVGAAAAALGAHAGYRWRIGRRPQGGMDPVGAVSGDVVAAVLAALASAPRGSALA